MRLKIQQVVSGMRTTGEAGVLAVTDVPQLSHGAPSTLIHPVNAASGRQSCCVLFEVEREGGWWLYLACTM